MPRVSASARSTYLCKSMFPMQVLTAMLPAALTAVPTVHQIRWLLSSPLKARSKRRCRLRYADIPITGSEADHCVTLVLNNMGRGVEVCH